MKLEEILDDAGNKVESAVNTNLTSLPLHSITEYETKDLISSGLLGKVSMFLLRNAGPYIINTYSLCNAIRGTYATSARGPMMLIDKETNGEIVGVAALMFETNGTASGFMATGKEYRGHGIGRSLVKRSIEIAQANGSAYIANVDKTNVPSQKIMESLGMHITGSHNEGRHNILEYSVRP